MASEASEIKKVLGLEKWWQHVIQALTVMSIVWFAVNITDLKTSSAILDVKLDTLQTRVSDFSSRTADRYTRTEAMEDLARLIERHTDFEQRLRKLENGGRVSP